MVLENLKLNEQLESYGDFSDGQLNTMDFSFVSFLIYIYSITECSYEYRKARGQES